MKNKIFIASMFIFVLSFGFMLGYFFVNIVTTVIDAFQQGKYFDGMLGLSMLLVFVSSFGIAIHKDS